MEPRGLKALTSLIMLILLTSCYMKMENGVLPEFATQNEIASTDPTHFMAPPTLQALNKVIVNQMGVANFLIQFEHAESLNLEENQITLLKSRDLHCELSLTDVSPMARMLNIFNCTGDGNIRFFLPAGVATNAAGQVSPEIIFDQELVIDNTPPAPTISAPSSHSIKTMGNVLFAVDYGEPVEITLEDHHMILAPTEGVTCSKKIGWAGTRSRTLSLSNCSGSGKIKVRLAPGSAMDLAGNPALESSFSDEVTTPYGPPTQLKISGPRSLITGACSAAFVVSRLDSSAHISPLDSAQSVVLGGVKSGNFYLDPTCASAPVSSLEIPAHASTERFYIRDFESESLNLNVSATGLTPASMSLKTKDISALSAGVYHVCGILGGALYCWGRNSSGQLGLGTKLSTSVPSPVVGLATGVQAVVAGIDHSCALVNSGVKCWGDNQYGQLGVESVTESRTPIDVAGLTSGVQKIFSGLNHVCAILMDGTARCWGKNEKGQLGNNSFTNSAVPVAVIGLNNLTSMAGGFDHTCAVAGGTVYCWGRNSHGQLGDGTLVDRPLPTAVVGPIENAAMVTAGLYHTCMSRVTGSVLCWGYNYYGQLGDNGSLDSLIPVTPIGLGAGVRQISAGYYHTCIVVNGAVMCFGRNTYGQLGLVNLINHRMPTAVPFVSDGVVALHAGGYSTCAIQEGVPKCWGFNNYGQLGKSSINKGYLTLPTIVAGVISPSSKISSGQYHSCTIASAGAGYCWGYDSDGQIGDNSSLAKWAPVPLAGALNLIDIAVGDSHSCGVTDQGDGYCWGANGDGQLGDGSLTSSSVPISVQGLTGNTTHMELGDQFSCALTTNGFVKCWGRNTYGQLGLVNNEDQLVPMEVPGLIQVSELSAGYAHVCAIANGQLKCWGRNTSGQLGDGSSVSTSLPTIPETMGSGVSHVTAGFLHTCAIKNDNTLWCWGRNNYGQLGTGGLTDKKTPVQITGINGTLTAVSAGYYHTCALASGSVWCWGRNDVGQLGDGTVTNRLAPKKLVGVVGLSSVSAGNYHNCVVAETSGEISCWGSKSWGQAGDGIVPQASIGADVGPFDIEGNVLDVFDNNGAWLASFTNNSQTVTTRGPTRILSEQSAEDPVLRTVIHDQWVRILPEPFSGEVDNHWLEAALQANQNEEPDVLSIALQYIRGAPAILDSDGVQIAGDSSYGPYLPNGSREEGSDFYDYLGLDWVFPDKKRKHDPDQFRSVDCSGLMRMVWGYRSGLPLEYVPDPDLPGIPRRAFEIFQSGPGIVVIENTGSIPTSFSALKPGDLVFWDADSGDGPQLDHVGLYLGIDTKGNLRFISSRKSIDGPTMGDYKGQSILNGAGLYSDTFRAARRF